MSDQTNYKPVSDQTNYKPNRKVSAAGLAGALATILAYLTGELVGLDLPPAVVTALTTVLTVGTGYWVKEV